MRAALLALLLAFWAGSAVAHAVLLETFPADGARLAAAPASVALRFNETVVPISARLISSEGAVAMLAQAARGTAIEIALPDGLGPGGYYVVWRVASADTHPISGTLAFSFGDAAPLVSGSFASGDVWRVEAIVARALRDLALALGVGGAAFLALVGGTRGRALFGALALAAVATLANMALAGARIAETDPWTQAAWRAGWASTAGSSALVVLAGIAFAALPGRLAPWIGLTGVGLAAALTGHAATAEPRWLFGGAQALHVIAALFWLGAFVPLYAELRRAPARAAEWGAKFSPFGIVAVAALTIAGAVSTIHHAAGISPEYAVLLVAKAVLLGALVFVAAENRNEIVPALRRGEDGAARRFARHLRIEMALGLTVVALAAALAHTPPTATMRHAHGHGHAIGPRADLSLATTREGRVLAIERAGTRLELRISSAAGAPIDTKEVAVELASGVIEALRRVPARLGPGHYALDEPALALPGPWKIRVAALIDDFTLVEFETELRAR